MMSAPSVNELESWFSLLGLQSLYGHVRCETDEERIVVCEHLLKYARKDKMSASDEEFIRAGLDLLRARVKQADEEIRTS